MPPTPALALLFLDDTLPEKAQFSIVTIPCVLPTMPPTPVELLLDTVPSTLRLVIFAPFTDANKPSPFATVKFLMVWLLPSKVPPNALVMYPFFCANGVQLHKTMSFVSLAQSVLLGAQFSSPFTRSRNHPKSATLLIKNGSVYVPLPSGSSAASAMVGSRPTTITKAISRDSARFFIISSSFCMKKASAPARACEPCRRRKGRTSPLASLGSRCWAGASKVVRAF